MLRQHFFIEHNIFLHLRVYILFSLNNYFKLTYSYTPTYILKSVVAQGCPTHPCVTVSATGLRFDSHSRKLNRFLNFYFDIELMVP